MIVRYEGKENIISKFEARKKTEEKLKSQYRRKQGGI